MDPFEVVDIVDENDQVLSQTTKADAHAKGLLHRCVIAEVIDSSGRWMMVRHSPHKQDKNQFVSPMGGHIRAGENVEEALKREVLEELGIENFKFKLVGKAIFNRPVNGHIENHLFIVYETFSDLEPTLNDEAVEWKKFSKEELKTALEKTPELFGDAFHFLVKKLYPSLA